MCGNLKKEKTFQQLGLNRNTSHIQGVYQSVLKMIIPVSFLIGLQGTHTHGNATGAAGASKFHLSTGILVEFMCAIGQALYFVPILWLWR